MSSLCDSEKLSFFFFLQGKLNYDILLKMKFVSWAILGLTVDLRDILLQQSQWMPCCGDTCPLSRKPSCLKILLTPSSPHPEGTVPVQQHHPAPFPSAAAFSLQVPAGLTVVLWLIGRTAHQVQRAAEISLAEGWEANLLPAFVSHKWNIKAPWPLHSSADHVTSNFDLLANR